MFSAVPSNNVGFYSEFVDPRVQADVCLIPWLSHVLVYLTLAKAAAKLRAVPLVTRHVRMRLSPFLFQGFVRMEDAIAVLPNPKSAKDFVQCSL